jgi:hypothetical protein
MRVTIAERLRVGQSVMLDHTNLMIKKIEKDRHEVEIEGTCSDGKAVTWYFPSQTLVRLVEEPSLIEIVLAGLDQMDNDFNVDLSPEQGYMIPAVRQLIDHRKGWSHRYDEEECVLLVYKD